MCGGAGTAWAFVTSSWSLGKVGWKMREGGVEDDRVGLCDQLVVLREGGVEDEPRAVDPRLLRLFPKVPVRLHQCNVWLQCASAMSGFNVSSAAVMPVSGFEVPVRLPAQSLALRYQWTCHASVLFQGTSGPVMPVYCFKVPVGLSCLCIVSRYQWACHASVLFQGTSAAVMPVCCFKVPVRLSCQCIVSRYQCASHASVLPQGTSARASATVRRRLSRSTAQSTLAICLRQTDQ